MIIDDVATAGKPAATSARKLTFLQKERWKAIQKARRKGMSLRSIEREMGIHRGTIKQYLGAEGPPTRQPRMGPATPTSGTIPAYPSDIYAEHLTGHFPWTSTPQWCVLSPPLTLNLQAQYDLAAAEQLVGAEVRVLPTAAGG